jgi:hypothetical protein
MPRKRIDGVIEAVRYTPDGDIEFVRLYERQGSVWTDHFLLTRPALVKQLEAGKRLYTGQRIQYLGSKVDAQNPVSLANGKITSGKGNGGRDLLDGVPVF